MRPITTLLLFAVLALALAGCAGEEEEGGDTDSAAETAPTTTEETVGETTEAPGAAEETTGAEQTAEVAEVAEDPDLGVREGGRISALAGLEDADRAAGEWQDDVELYSIAASAPPEVDVEGLSGGWLYSFVSPSTNSIVQVSVTTEEVERLPEQEMGEEFAQDIAGDALPNPENLKDSPQAIEESQEIRDALQSDPDLGLSAGLDSASSENPVWILQVVGAERLDDRVDAIDS